MTRQAPRRSSSFMVAVLRRVLAEDGSCTVEHPYGTTTVACLVSIHPHLAPESRAAVSGCGLVCLK